MDDEAKIEKVFTFEKEHEYLLPLIEETLNAENIKFFIRSNYDTAYDGLFIGQKGLGSLYVHESNRERALALLQDILQQSPEE